MIAPEFWSIPHNTLSPAEFSKKPTLLVQRLSDIAARFSDIRFATSLDDHGHRLCGVPYRYPRRRAQLQLAAGLGATPCDSGASLRVCAGQK